MKRETFHCGFITFHYSTVNFFFRTQECGSGGGRVAFEILVDLVGTFHVGAWSRGEFLQGTLGKLTVPEWFSVRRGRKRTRRKALDQRLMI